MQVGGARTTSRAAERNNLAGVHLLPALHEGLGRMPIESPDSGVMVYDNESAVNGILSDLSYNSVPC
tara:strand:+ start:2993 stop:3193 length:201 start_codon:yes stop_codon:yes gene_type:complete